MQNYYFVVPSLPPLSIRGRPELSFVDMMERLKICLSRKDLEKTKVIRLFVDICNIRALFLEEDIDPHGNLSEKELDEALLLQTNLPEYVFHFLSQFKKVSDKISHFPGLLALFFNEELRKWKGFLHSYLMFERESRLVLVGLRAKRLGIDLLKELQFEDPKDPLVAHLLAQKDMDRYDPPTEYQDLKDLMDSCYQDPWAEYEAFALYRFRRLEEMAEGKAFSVDRILCYMAQLMIVEDLFELDAQKGAMILDTFKSG